MDKELLNRAREKATRDFAKKHPLPTVGELSHFKDQSEINQSTAVQPEQKFGTNLGDLIRSEKGEGKKEKTAEKKARKESVVINISDKDLDKIIDTAKGEVLAEIREEEEKRNILAESMNVEELKKWVENLQQRIDNPATKSEMLEGYKRDLELSKQVLRQKEFDVLPAKKEKIKLPGKISRVGQPGEFPHSRKLIRMGLKLDDFAEIEETEKNGRKAFNFYRTDEEGNRLELMENPESTGGNSEKNKENNPKKAEILSLDEFRQIYPGTLGVNLFKVGNRNSWIYLRSYNPRTGKLKMSLGNYGDEIKKTEIDLDELKFLLDIYKSDAMLEQAGQKKEAEEKMLKDIQEQMAQFSKAKKASEEIFRKVKATKEYQFYHGIIQRHAGERTGKEGEMKEEETDGAYKKMIETPEFKKYHQALKSAYDIINNDPRVKEVLARAEEAPAGKEYTAMQGRLKNEEGLPPEEKKKLEIKKEELFSAWQMTPEFKEYLKVRKTVSREYDNFFRDNAKLNPDETKKVENGSLKMELEPGEEKSGTLEKGVKIQDASNAEEGTSTETEQEKKEKPKRTKLLTDEEVDALLKSLDKEDEKEKELDARELLVIKEYYTEIIKDQLEGISKYYNDPGNKYTKKEIEAGVELETGRFWRVGINEIIEEETDENYKIREQMIPEAVKMIKKEFNISE